MKNGGKNQSIAFIILFSVVISIPETFNVLDLLDVRDPWLDLAGFPCMLNRTGP